MGTSYTQTTKQKEETKMMYTMMDVVKAIGEVAFLIWTIYVFSPNTTLEA